MLPCVFTTQSQISFRHCLFDPIALFQLILTTNPMKLCQFCGCGNWSLESFVFRWLVHGRAESHPDNFHTNTTGANMSLE